MFAEVAVDAPASLGTLTYHVPPGLPVQPGCLVWAPLGGRLVQGLVFACTDQPAHEPARDLADLIEPEPLVSEARLQLARWIATRYLCSLYVAAELLLPPGSARRMGVWHKLVATPAQLATIFLTRGQKRVVGFLHQHGQATIEETRQALRGRGVAQVLEQLLAKGVVARIERVEGPAIRPKIEERVELAADWPAVLSALAHSGRASREADLLLALAAGPRPARELRRELKCPPAPLRGLVDAGLLQLDGEAVRLAPDLEASDRLLEAVVRRRRPPRYLVALQMLRDHGPLPIGELHRRAHVGRSDLVPLVEQQLLRLVPVARRRDPLAGQHFPATPWPILTAAQADACKQLQAALQESRPGRAFLLHGVTGSGKTEVYLRALEAVVRQGGQGIVLVPEIALTPQTTRRFVARFPGRLAIIHSRLSPGERFDEWHRIRAGAVDVVVGSRSALFAPLPQVRLIVLDEEHEWTYKQHEESPYYHARDTAIELARLTGATVVLGSATPDVVSYHRATTGEYRLLELPERVLPPAEPAGKPTVLPPGKLPPVEVVDLREELRAGNRSIFSRSLHRAMAAALGAGEQVILFLNRRGTATFILCRDCGFVARCKRCDVPLAFHGAEADLVCHLCNYRTAVPDVCPACWSRRIRFLGLGTQKVEEEAARAFPQARLLRWDRDVTRGRHAHEAILDRFIRHEADVLIGTQMIAKGLDLPQVTLVGVISADVGLHLPDYRAGERTFQVLTQVAGRAGRSLLGGRVIIQTYTPEQYAIAAASRHDYATFYEREVEFRRRHAQPPFTRLARVLYSDPNRQRAQTEAERVHRLLRQRLEEQGELGRTALIGPAPAWVHRLRGRYRWQIVVRGPEPERVLARLGLARGWVIDVDPVSLL